MKMFRSILLITSHLICVAVLELFCADKLIWYYNWSAIDDWGLILATLIYLGLHYFLCCLAIKLRLVRHQTDIFLLGFELIITLPVMLILLIPNPFLHFSSFSQFFSILIVQLEILVARAVYVLYTKFKKR